MLAVLLHLPELGGRVRQSVSQPQNYLLKLLAKFVAISKLRLKGSNLIMEATLLALAIFNLGS